MNKMWIAPLGLAIIGGLLIGIAYIQDIKFSTSARIPEGWSFALPKGNAHTGKEAFMRMQCHVCHRVNLPELQLPKDAEWSGPDLTIGYNNLPDTYLAESIIKVHTVVADPQYAMRTDMEGMGKYNHHLTVKELIDLVTFLKQSPEELMSQK